MERLKIEDIWNVVPEAEMRSPEELEDWGYIIGAMSSMFFSTYYMNLERDTFRAVTQLNRVGDVLGDEVSYSAGLMLYANHFVHPDDRAEFLKKMSLDNLRESLRWWNPMVATEYRKLDDARGKDTTAFRWVRATVVLARTGANDLPYTAVYTAQDITGSRRDCTSAGMSCCGDN